MALKYHPDKNPSTTPLFHVIHGAYEKLIQKVESRPIYSEAPPTATSPTKPKTSNTKHNKSQSDAPNADSFRKYQSKPNKSTAYRDPKDFPQNFDCPKPPTFEQSNASNSHWADPRSMAGDNDPLPGQNTYEGFRGYTQFPKQRTQSDTAAKPTNHRRNSDSSINSGASNFHQFDDAKERNKRRQAEYEAASARIAERRAQQQQRNRKDHDSYVPKSTSRHENKQKDVFDLPIPSEVQVNRTNTHNDAVDITWKRYSSSTFQSLKVELSWRILPSKPSNSSWKVGQSRSIDDSPDWIISSQLITANTIRKKNLTLGARYEFRLRYVLILDESECEYKRGEWSLPVSITISSSTKDSLNHHSLSIDSKYSVEITEMKAKGLYSKTLFGISNPYVACTINGVRYKTNVLSHTNQPIWSNEKITFTNVSLTDSLHLEVFDKELISRKALLGEIYIPLSDLKITEMLANWLILTGGSSEDSDEVSQVYVSIRVFKENTRLNTHNHSEDSGVETGYVDTQSKLPELIYYQLVPPKNCIAKEFLYPVYSHSSILTIVGYLTPLKYILVDISQTDENWMYVQCHFDEQDQTNFLKSPLWGWCQRVQNKHKYFQLVSNEYQSQGHPQSHESSAPEDEESDDDDSEEDNEIPVWYQLRDESSGYYYYYNEKTGESEWDPPEWIEEYDPISGSRYYVHLNSEDSNPIETTWRKPPFFARLVREMSK